MEEPRALSDLLDLQAVDSEIDRLLAERQSLPELAEYREAHEELSRLTDQHQAAADALRETTLALDRTNGELEIGELKLDQEQNRLYAGGMSARDADYLRQEVEMLTRKKVDLEDRVLELMEAKEEHEGVAESLEAHVAAAAERKRKLEGAIATAWKVLDAKVAVKEARKADIVPLIDPALLELYEELRPVKEGVAAGRLADGVCGGCHLTLTPAEQLQVLRNDPPRCIHCRRILVP